MKILFVTPYVPYPPKFGGSVRIYHMARALARRHEVSIVSYREQDGLGDPGGLEPFCSRVVTVPRDVERKRARQLLSLASPRSFQVRSHASRAMERAVRETARDTGAEVILVEFSQMAGLRFPPGIPLVVDEHNVEYDLLLRMALRDGPSFRKAFNLLEALKFRREERAFLRRADRALATSERDAELLRKLAPGLSAAVVTNGVDTAHFRRPPGPRRRNHAVFVGATHYFPNEDGVLFFAREVLPLVRDQVPDFTFSVVGGQPAPALRELDGPSIRVTGFVDDVRPHIWEASVFVVPLRMGGGTRFKVVEALAAEAPVVSTSLGAEGIPARHGRDLLLADTPEAFAGEVVRVLRDEPLARSLQENGLGFVRERYDWAVVGRTLEHTLQELLERRGP